MIEDDISRHFREKLSVIIGDIISTCKIADLKPIDISGLVFSGLMWQVIKLAATIKLTEDELLAATSLAYRDTMSELRKMLKEDARASRKTQ